MFFFSSVCSVSKMSQKVSTYVYVDDWEIEEWLMRYWQRTLRDDRAPKSAQSYRYCYSEFEVKMKITKLRFESEKQYDK